MWNLDATLHPEPLDAQEKLQYVLLKIKLLLQMHIESGKDLTERLRMWSPWTPPGHRPGPLLGRSGQGAEVGVGMLRGAEDSLT